jgi:ubiquinol-cytochrome c reductase cytochrome b subunit
VGRIGCIVLPPIAYVITYRICLGLQQHDREVLEHGIETGVIRRLPHGEFIEVHQPLGPVDEHGHSSLAYGGAPIPKKMNHVGGARRAIRGFFSPIEEPSAVELEQRAEGRGLAAGEPTSGELTRSGRPSEGGRPSDGGRPQEPRD